MNLWQARLTSDNNNNMYNNNNAYLSNQWHESAFLLGGCRVNPFQLRYEKFATQVNVLFDRLTDLRACTVGKSPWDAFIDCLFYTHRRRVAQPNSCRRDRGKMQFCSVRYPHDGFSAIMCYLLPLNWNV